MIAASPEMIAVSSFMFRIKLSVMCPSMDLKAGS